MAYRQANHGAGARGTALTARAEAGSARHHWSRHDLGMARRATQNALQAVEGFAAPEKAVRQGTEPLGAAPGGVVVEGASARRIVTIYVMTN
jgi:hypothetical protein